MACCAEIILGYFFPPEKPRLQELAEECAEECAVSRLYAGVHFPVDNDEGLRLGRQIGHLAVYVLKPPPYKQAIPFKFSQKCQSKVKTQAC